MCMASDSSRYSAAIKAMWTRSKQKPTAGGRSRAHCCRVNIADAWAVCVQVAASLATHPRISYAICYMLGFTTCLLESLYTKLCRIAIKHRKRYLDFLVHMDSTVVRA